MNLLDNGIIIGVIGSVIATAVISIFIFFRNRIFRSRFDKAYRACVKAANNQLIHVIRPHLLDKKKISGKYLNALRLSLAKDYSINLIDLYSDYAIKSYFISDIMSNSYLNTEQKDNLCEFANDFIIEEKEKNVDESVEEIINEIQNKITITTPKKITLLNYLHLACCYLVIITAAVLGFNYLFKGLSLINLVIATILSIIIFLIVNYYILKVINSTFDKQKEEFMDDIAIKLQNLKNSQENTFEG